MPQGSRDTHGKTQEDNFFIIINSIATLATTTEIIATGFRVIYVIISIRVRTLVALSLSER